MKEMYHFSNHTRRAYDQILEYPLTVIEAGSGFGKTTALYQYFFKQTAAEYQHLVHVCLGEPAEDTWRCLCREIGMVDEQTAAYLSSIGLPTKDNMTDISYGIRTMQCRVPTILCIDNFQMFQVPDQNMLFEILSLHSCENLHIVILTNHFESNMKHQNLSRYGIYWITKEAFTFSEEDISYYFKKHDICLKPDTLNQIWQTTEGYVAAVCLQMEYFKMRGKVSDTVEITGLMEKAFFRYLNDAEQSCLIRLSVMDSFTKHQAEVLTKKYIEPKVLNKLIDSNDFISFDIQSSCYIMHCLLLTFLREKCSRLPKEEQYRIWRETAETYRETGDYILAAELYGRCGDYDRLMQLPWKRADRIPLVAMSGGCVIQEMIKPANRHCLEQNPEMTLILTLELYMQGKMELHHQYLQQVNRMLETPERYEERRYELLKGDYALMESFFAFNDVEKMCHFHREAFKFLKGPTRLYSLNAAWTFGIPSVVCMFYREQGNLQQEYQAVSQGLPIYYELSDHNGMGAPEAMEGEIQLLKGQDDAAEKSYCQAVLKAEAFHQDSICYCAYLGNARIALLRGNIATYVHMKENIENMMYHGREPRGVFTADMCNAYINLLLNRTQDIPQWLYSEEGIRGNCLMFAYPFAHIIYGWLLLEQLKKREIEYSEFEARIHRINMEDERFHMILPTVYLTIYLAIAADMYGETLKAQELLKEALHFAAADQLYFIFAEHYMELKVLLEKISCTKDIQEAMTQIQKLGKRYEKGRAEILSSFRHTNNALSDREREVAGLLKKRLSVKEIAERLCISKSTVSNTMQKIYSKLDIHSRRELYYRDDI